MRPELQTVYEDHFEYVWRTLLRLGLPESAVADTTQDVFLVVHRRLPTYDPARPIRPWLFGIARNLVREERRRVAVRRESANAPESGRDDGSFPRLEAVQIVRRALEALTKAQREVFVLHALDEVPMKEVADTLGMPVNTAYSHFRRGRAGFRAAAERMGALS